MQFSSGSGIPFGRILGIPIRLDLTFFIAFGLIVFLLSTELLDDVAPPLGDLERWVYGLGGGAIFFAALLAHELAHSLMARRYGMDVASITLFVFGGVSLIKEDSRRPGQELWISIVGPLASLLIGIAFVAVSQWILAPGTAIQELCRWMGWINILLAAFNMLPGFPLDGGLVARAAIWRATGSRHRATAAAARLGQLLGAGIAGLGIAILLFDLGGDRTLNGFWLILVGGLLFMQAQQGRRAAQLERDLTQLRVSQIMRQPPEPRTVEEDLPVRVVVPVRHALDHRASFIVASGGAAGGIAPAPAILLLDDERYQQLRMRDGMQPADQIEPIEHDGSGDEALRRVQSEQALILPVGQAGRLLGIIGYDQIWATLRDGPPPAADPQSTQG